MTAMKTTGLGGAAALFVSGLVALNVGHGPVMVAKSHVVSVDSARTFEVLADVGGWDVFHPGIDASSYIGSAESTVGAQVSWTLRDGKGVALEEISALEPGERVGVRMIEGPLPARSATVDFMLTAEGDMTRVDMRMEIVPTGGLVGRALASTVGAMVLGGKMADVLEGLDTYLTTGSKVASAS